MLSFFTPQLKIQKNRQVLRDTDERMAKYSRRGLMSNFVIFLLCMAVGDFVDQQPGLAIGLSIGLLITTLLRGYLLFRFEALYPRAPALWRTRYFYATLLGAAWWGFIVALETLIVGINHEGPLLWLYTIVFFSMTANAFAPYKQFLTLYQLLGLVPGAFCLLFIGELTGVIYGVVVFFFIWLLHHQCEQMADNYWERLESTDSLARKTESLEEEKRDTRATAQLHRDYMLLLKKELEALLKAKRAPRHDDTASDKQAEPEAAEPAQVSPVIARPDAELNKRPRLQQLHDSVSDFYQILTKDIDFQQATFNPKSLVQFIIAQYTEQSHQKQLDIELIFSPNLPHLVSGDAQRLAQILRSMMNAIINQLDDGTLFIDVDYIQERGKAGDLSIATNHQPSGQRTLFNAQQTQTTGIQLNLELALATGLAEAQEGSLDITANNQGTQLRYRAAYPSQTLQDVPAGSIPALKGKHLLLVHENPRVLDSKRQELSRLGLTVTTESLFKRGLSTLRAAITSNTPFSAVVFHCHADPKATADFSRALLAEHDCKLIPQIIMGSAQAKTSEVFTDLVSAPNIYWIDKPATTDDFKQCFWRLFNQDEQLTEQSSLDAQAAIVAEESTEQIVEQLSAAGVACKGFSTIKALQGALEKDTFKHAVFIDSGGSYCNNYETLREIQPDLYIAACDLPQFAQQHLENGADYFIPSENIGSNLAIILKSLD
ncbi:MAG TPA: hypothetical protein VIC26_16885 [Marinagarivorans sp.]